MHAFVWAIVAVMAAGGAAIMVWGFRSSSLPVFGFGLAIVGAIAYGFIRGGMFV